MKKLEDEIQKNIENPELILEFKIAAKHIVRDWRKGLGTPDGTGMFITEEDAFFEAKRIYAERTLEKGMKDVYNKWEEATKARVSKDFIDIIYYYN